MSDQFRLPGHFVAKDDDTIGEISERQHRNKGTALYATFALRFLCWPGKMEKILVRNNSGQAKFIAFRRILKLPLV
jgi:hypothetical protein